MYLSEIPFQAPVKPFRDPSISLEAKGLLAVIYSTYGEDDFEQAVRDSGINIDKHYYSLLDECLETEYVRKEFSGQYKFTHETVEEEKSRELWEDRQKEKIINTTEIDPVFVYIIETNNKYKIGIAGDLSNRVRQITTSSPYQVTVLYYHKMNSRKSAIEKEKLLHDKFSTKRLRGEWFELDKDDLDWIKRELG